jgi:hypothetical protein
MVILMVVVMQEQKEVQELITEEVADGPEVVVELMLERVQE